MAARDGYFYAIALAPDAMPGRVKLGWTVNPTARLRQHRCAAPTAVALATWPLSREREGLVIKAATAVGCIAVSREVFDCEDMAALLAQIERAILNPPPSSARTALTESEELVRRREALGLSINALARALGVAASTVMRWERGIFPPPRWLDRAMRDVERNPPADTRPA